jgi:hypothetical protein
VSHVDERTRTWAFGHVSGLMSTASIIIGCMFMLLMNCRSYAFGKTGALRFQVKR